MELAVETVKIDNIEVWVYKLPTMSGLQWDSFTTEEKIRISESCAPIQHATARNTTTLDMHEWLVDRVDPFGTLGTDISELAVGRSTTTPTESDTGLNDEVDRVEITSSTRETDTLRIKTFLDKEDGNVDVGAGESLSEVGLYAGSSFLNHAVLTNDIDKTSTKTATVDVLITFDAP